ncbi:MAG: PIG-L family deacetylase [Candidatus Berkelbacteria bacterium]|nr:PIG-L family deacetylase [Candidatus Berkelbacteria bacterium]
MPKIDLKIVLSRRFLLVISVIAMSALAGYLLYSHYTQVLPDSAIHFLNDVPQAQSGDKVLVFSPHPDDESLAVGGFIADAEKSGAEVEIVLVTDGNKHGLKEKRYAEFGRATADLEVKSSDLVYLNHKDGALQLENQQVIRDQFKQIIDTFKPNIIFSPSSSDSHLDHKTTGERVNDVLSQENFSGKAYQYLVHAAHYPQPKSYEPDQYLLPPLRLITFDKEWQRYLLSSSTENAKYKAVMEYQSQLKTPILRGVMMSLIRQNELFAVSGGN